MFTGLILEVGKLISKSSGDGSARVTISATKIIEDFVIGDSIACNGVCLTVVESSKNSFSADISYETIKRSSFSNIQIGSPVNLELALRISDRLGGHLVSGHVDSMERLLSVEKIGNGYKLTISTSAEIERYIASKGSITVDGISLTVSDIRKGSFDIAVIPHTYSNTNLHFKRVGDVVNIEVDQISRYVERLLDKDNNKSSKDDRLLNLLQDR